MSSVVELVRSWPLPRALALAVIAARRRRMQFRVDPVQQQSLRIAARSHRFDPAAARAPTGQRADLVAAAAERQPARDHAGERRVGRGPRDGVLPSGQSPDPITTGSVQAPPPAQSPHSAAAAGSPVQGAGIGKIAPTQPIVHVVAPGETLIAIARKYNMPLAELARLNNIPPHTKVNIGDRITIPASRARPRDAARTQKVAAQPKALSAPQRPRPNRRRRRCRKRNPRRPRFWPATSRPKPPASRRRPSRRPPPIRSVPAMAACHSAGRRRAASSRASVRRPTARPTTASTSRCRKARRSRRPRTASSPMPATSSRATAIWCWCATPTAT